MCSKKKVQKNKKTMIDRLVRKCEKATQKNNFKNYNNIDKYINSLLYEFLFELETQALLIQSNELEVAYTIFDRQYENEFMIIDILFKCIEKSNDINDIYINNYEVLNNLEKRKDAVNFFNKKTYSTKPKKFLKKTLLNIFNSDIIMRNIYKNVPRELFKTIYSRFIKEIDDYQCFYIQKELNNNSIIMSEQVETLNLLVDEINILINRLLDKKFNRSEIRIILNDKKNKIKRNDKLVSSYKKLQDFAIYLGYRPIRQNGTSHLIFSNSTKNIVIPNKKGDIGKGLLSSIIKQLGSTRERFIEFEKNYQIKENNNYIKFEVLLDKGYYDMKRNLITMKKESKIIADEVLNLILFHKFNLNNIIKKINSIRIKSFKANDINVEYVKELDIHNITYMIEGKNKEVYTVSITGHLCEETLNYFPKIIYIINIKENIEKSGTNNQVNDRFTLDVSNLIGTIIKTNYKYNQVYTSIITKEVIKRKELLKYRYDNQCIYISLKNRIISLDILNAIFEEGINDEFIELGSEVEDRQVEISNNNDCISVKLLKKFADTYIVERKFSSSIEIASSRLEKEILNYLII